MDGWISMHDLKKLRQIKNPLKCEICDKEFKNSNSLKYHFNITHNLEKEYQCNICQKVFHIKKILDTHVKIVHENKKNHNCNSCGNQNSVLMFTLTVPENYKREEPDKPTDGKVDSEG